MDRLHAMQVLVTVVDCRSLSAASRALNAPLPSVSRKVAELERHLGTRLITRTSRNNQLTDAGRDYVEAAREILDRLADAESRAPGEYNQPRGDLTVTIPVEFGRLMVAPIISDFLEEHPGVSLNIIYTNRIVQLAGGRACRYMSSGRRPSRQLTICNKIGRSDFHHVCQS